uniref:Uncharacterized protein n=1 Tax=Vitis vinifera TaxID=29760 RepID=A5CA78_VITVI|nr:hypothetical protein VITISV_023343 [Vitis vinifera]
MAFAMGNGRRVRIWKDKLYGDKLLSTSFPSLYVIASPKEAWVEDVWNPLAVKDCWARCFFRRFNDWKVEFVEHFLLRLQARKVCKEDVDDKVI